jgi:hypothetical protein
MTRNWRLIFRFAVTGFSIATLAAVCMVFHAPNVITNLLLLASPGIWLFLPKAWSGMGNDSGAVAMWLMFGFVAMANAVVCGIVGAAYVGLRRKPG